MRIPCPHCGERDLREFTCRGGAEALDRPAPDAPDEAWDSWLHLRENRAGRTRELWQHSGGCRAWLLVERDTLTHALYRVRDIALAGRGQGGRGRAKGGRAQGGRGR